MRRRGSSARIRLVLGLLAGALLFGASSVALGSIAAAAPAPGGIASLPAPCLPLLCEPSPLGQLLPTPTSTPSSTQGTGLCVLTICLPTAPPSATPCLAGCGGPTPTPTHGGTGGTGGTGPAGGSTGGGNPGVGGPAAGGGTHPAGSGAQPGGIGSGTATNGTTVGGSSAQLAVAPPPAIQVLSPASGLSFGKAPFLWPLFAVLDLFAVAAVAYVVRRTWSTRAAD